MCTETQNHEGIMFKHTYIGIDGCRGGWLFSSLSEAGHMELKLFRTLKESISILNQAHVICIDMPMGLVTEAGEERICDAVIRKELGHPFSSSVFNVPCQQAVYAPDYITANLMNREIQGKGISIQSWNIVPKIKELDTLLLDNASLNNKFCESHPELCFKSLKGETLTFKKKTKEGFAERLNLLRQKSGEINPELCKFLKKDVANDDILDSMVLAFNALKVAQGQYVVYPPNDNERAIGVSKVVYCLK